LNNDGVINDLDQTFLGSPHPDFTLNMTNNFDFKGFDFSFFFQGVFGNEILNLVRRDIEGMSGLANQSTVVIDRSRPGEPDDEIPRATYVSKRLDASNKYTVYAGLYQCTEFTHLDRLFWLRSRDWFF